MSTTRGERRAELAGAWYPETAAGCQGDFARFAAQAVPFAGEGPLHAAIVPHAGWVFSGAIAHNALAELARTGGPADTVVLFAGHMRPSAAPTVMTHGAFWTPLGSLESDEELARSVAEALPSVRAEGPGNHTQDNSFEVQLPLIKHFFADARLVAVGAPPQEAAFAVADGLLDAGQRLGRKLLFVGSTDLSHYGPNYGWSPQGMGAKAEAWVREENDPLFIDAVLAAAPAKILEVALAHRNACCPGAAAAAVHCAREAGATTGALLRYATSAEIHPSSSFVGYAGIVL